MEPPNWWVGMDSKEIQLMVHGNSIRDLDVTIDDDRIRINNIYRPENFNYLFIYLQILDEPLAFDFEIVFSKEGEVYEKYIYQLFNKSSLNRELGSFNSSDVIYLITPDRFANGDPSNDIDKTLREKKVNRRKPEYRHGGDIQGIINN